MVTSVNVLEVDLRKIRKNIEILKGKSDKKFFAVVKADAYGLGSVAISKNVEDLVDGYCVATLDEAIELKEVGIKKDVLILGYVHPDNYEYLEKYDIVTNLYDYSIAEQMAASDYKIRVHIKIETGHNRLGFRPEQKCFDQIKYINDNFSNIKIEGMFSHFSTADESSRDYTYRQEELFKKAVDGLADINEKWIKHISNDASVIAYDFNYDAVRSGISMYGMYPSEYMKEKYDIGIEYAFRLISKISFIKKLDSGEYISYGRTFQTDRPMKVATVSIGYADGYHRLISNKGYVLINDKKARILGRVTMDQMMVDVTDIDCNIHDDVVVIGKYENEEIDPDLVASWAETISYEIMTSISKRVARIYIE